MHHINLKTIYTSTTDSESNESSSMNALCSTEKNVTASDIVVPNARSGTIEVELKIQRSAPSYWNSLKENEAPPFRIPIKEPKPHLMINSIMSSEDVVLMVAASSSPQTLRQFLARFLTDKKVVDKSNLAEKEMVINLVLECIEHGKRNDFNSRKLSVLIAIYLFSHLYFKWYYWHTPDAVWAYFKEALIRHTITDCPYAEKVFEPEEAYDIMTHFHTLYMRNLPLIHILSFKCHRVKFMWPFKKE